MSDYMYLAVGITRMYSNIEVEEYKVNTLKPIY